LKILDQNSNGHSNIITCLAKLNNNRFTSGSNDKTIKIWDLTGNFIKTIETTYCFKSFINISDIQIAIAGNFDISIFDLNSGECIKIIQCYDDYIKCLVKLNENQIASGSLDRTIKIWDLNVGVCVKTLKGHRGNVCCLFKLNENQLLSGSDDSTIKV